MKRYRLWVAFPVPINGHKRLSVASTDDLAWAKATAKMVKATVEDTVTGKTVPLAVREEAA